MLWMDDRFWWEYKEWDIRKYNINLDWMYKMNTSRDTFENTQATSKYCLYE